ncbi:MAG: crossover junction endodeoxyribonuclease RuvC [Spirochaetota bacterium]
MIRILGIDPGLAQTGYGVIEVEGDHFHHIYHGSFTTSPQTSSGMRLKVIYDGIIRVINTYKPDEAGVESLFFAKNITSALPVAQARGVILLALAKKNIPAAEYAPPEIKQAIVGTGRAEKNQVQELVRFLLGLKEIPQPDHAADALAAAICHYNNFSKRKLMEPKERRCSTV